MGQHHRQHRLRVDKGVGVGVGQGRYICVLVCVKEVADGGGRMWGGEEGECR